MLNNLWDSGSDTMTVYGVGVSFIQARALSVTFSKILNLTNAVFYEEPCEHEYFCYVYYLDRASCLRAYVMFSKNFAIVSSALYEREIGIKELADILDGKYPSDDEDEDN